jgi:hypothetical protein
VRSGKVKPSMKTRPPKSRFPTQLLTGGNILIAVTMCDCREMRQRKPFFLFSICVRSLRGLWLYLILIILILTLIPWFYSSLFFSNSTASPSTTFEDPFFTLTSRGMRKCYPYSSEASISLGYLLLDSPSLYFNQTERNTIRSNLLHSIRKTGKNPFVEIIDSDYVGQQNKINVLVNFIQSHLSSLPPVLLISTSLEVILMLSSSEKLEESFYLSKQRLIFSQENPTGLAIGYTEDILKFYHPMTLRPGLIKDERLKEMVKKKVWSQSSKGVLGFVMDQDSLLLASQSSSSSTLNPPPHLIQISFPQQRVSSSSTAAAEMVPAKAQFSLLYNSYLRSSLSLSSSDTAPHHHHSYDHFLSHRSQYRVVITLTTLPHRLPHLFPVLQSLLNQHVKPDQVYLNLPTSYRRFNSTSSSPTTPLAIPHDIQRLVLNDILRIQLVPVDYGPATKLIPTLEVETDPSTIIITVDDDMIYKPTQVQLLLRAYFHFPHAAYGYAGQLIDLDPQPMDRKGSMRGRMIRGKKRKERVAVRTAWQWKVTVLSSRPLPLLYFPPSLSSIHRTATMLLIFSKLSVVHFTEEISFQTFLS